MHTASIELMKTLVDKYIVGTNLKILELGSQIIKKQELLGCYRDLFKKVDCNYIGVDIQAGLNVDIVLTDGYKFPFSDNEFDYVISGQTMEHIEFPWEWLGEVKRVLKKGGIAIIIAPAFTHQHRYPIDTFRYFPDGMVALCKWNGLDVIDSKLPIRDTYLVAKKHD